MQKFISLLILAALLIFMPTLRAYDPPAKKASGAVIGTDASAINKNAVLQSMDNAKVYIDFDDIPVNLKCIQLMDRNGKVLFKDAVNDFPVNGLYEVDLTPYAGQEIILEVQSYTDSRFFHLGSLKP